MLHYTSGRKDFKVAAPKQTPQETEPIVQVANDAPAPKQNLPATPTNTNKDPAKIGE